MSTKKHTRQGKGNRQNVQSGRSDKQVKGWNRKRVVIVIALILGGILVIALINHATDNAPGAPPAQSTTDAYGRPPGDPHYGHSHP